MSRSSVPEVGACLSAPPKYRRLLQWLLHLLKPISLSKVWEALLIPLSSYSLYSGWYSSWKAGVLLEVGVTLSAVLKLLKYEYPFIRPCTPLFIRNHYLPLSC